MTVGSSKSFPFPLWAEWPLNSTVAAEFRRQAPCVVLILGLDFGREVSPRFFLCELVSWTHACSIHGCPC